MSNRNTAKKIPSPLRVVHATGIPKHAGLEELLGVIETQRVARKHGLDLRVSLHVASSVVDVTNVVVANADSSARSATKVLPRFTNLDANCKPVAIGVEHVAVYDSLQDLIFTKAKLPGEANHADSLKKCKDLRLFGRTDWRAPSAHERFAIADVTKRDPAIDTKHFAKESGTEWTADVFVNADGSPSDDAWYVGLGGGLVNWYSQSYLCGVRAVCAGQQLALSL